jgi:alpha-glucosidase
VLKTPQQTPPPGRHPWWRRGAVYQIYPRSFCDSNGDGIGDLPGIISRLDHLAALRVQALWLSPVFRSPMRDFGYDVADHCDIDPVFGTLDDLDRLIEESHARGIKVVMEWIANHTSDRHPWFVEARSSRTNPRRDWYVWRDEPNNWRSHFAAVGSAWSYDEATEQWYLHSFTPEQPDLNWDNPEVRAAMLDILRFWLRRGVDGFRLDAISSIAKDPLLRDNVPGERRRDEDWHTIHERLRAIRRVADAFGDRMLAGEVLPMDVRRIVRYVAGEDQLHMAHNFVFVEQPWDASGFRASIDAFAAHAEPTTWPAWFLSNHDYPRVASRFDDHGQGAARARAVALLLYTLRGTPFVFQGEELGLPDLTPAPGTELDLAGRDRSRAPIPWRAGRAAGFTTGRPWLPLVDGAEALSVERQAADPRSMLTLVRRLARLRAESEVLQDGAQQTLSAGPDVLAWLRTGATGERLLGLMNFSPARAGLELAGSARLVISSDPARLESTVDLASLTLAPSEAVLVRR